MTDAPQEQSPSIGQLYLNSVQNGGDPGAVPEAAPAPALATPPAPDPQNAQPAAPAQPAQPAVDPATAKHNLIGRFFQSITSGGTGSSASNFWRSLIGGALVGMGAAENAPVVAHGPYGDVRDKSAGGAASRAWSAEQGNIEHQKEIQQRQDQIDKQNKQREFENKLQMDDQTLRKAADARAQQESIRQSVEHEKRMKMLDNTIAGQNWEQAQRTADAAQKQVAFFNSLQEVGAQPLAGQDGEPLQFATHDEAEKAAHDNPKFFIGDFKTRTAYDPGTGKYGVYRVPDTDIKNVQLRDQQGVVHNIPRMSAGDYLDFQLRQQNLQKGALGIQEAQERLKQLREDRKSSSAYGKALGELDKVAGDADKLSPSSRTVLYTTASKNLGDAIRAKTAADKAEDAEAQAAASDAIKHYSGVLSQLHGRNPNAAQGTNLAPQDYDKALQHALTLPADQAIAEINSAKVLSDADKQKLVKDISQKRLESVAPYMTALKAPDGKTINVMNADVPAWTAKGYAIVGRGAAPQPVPSSEVEREK
jgi:hypothetical protein